jgi:AcrR family transcriptional regulator
MRPRSATSEEILGAADRLARREGIDKLTIRRLCADLQVTAPAIYSHFSSKDQLVAQLVDRILAGVDHPEADVDDWVINR